MKSLVRSGVALVAAAALGAGLALGGAAMGNGRNGNGNGNGNGLGGQPATASQIYLDEIKDYGVCRGVGSDLLQRVGQRLDRGRAEADPHLEPYRRPAPRPPRHAAGARPEPAAERGQRRPGRARSHGPRSAGSRPTTPRTCRSSDLNNYQAVVFLSSNRDTLDDTAQTTLMQYIRGGGGFVGIHNAFGAEYHWPYYEGLLGGANFYNHGPNRDGTVETINNRDVSTSFMPKTWGFTGRVVQPGAVPELTSTSCSRSTRPRARRLPAGHGESHPVSWCQYYDGGKVVADDARARRRRRGPTLRFAGDEFFKQHVMEGLESAMGIKPFCTV